MNDTFSAIAEPLSEVGAAKQLADIARQFEQSQTGLLPQSATAVLENDSMVITLHGVLSPAEKKLAKTPTGANQVRELNRQRFMKTCRSLWQKFEVITGVAVLEATSEITTDTDTVVQVFRLAGNVPSSTWSESRGEQTSVDPLCGIRERISDGEG